MKRHVSVIVTGIIQGIGFRPFCARLAEKTDVRGSVRNTPSGVRIELYGTSGKVDSYIERLRTDCPTLGHIQSITLLLDENAGTEAPLYFDILESEPSVENTVLIPPDIATCDECLREMQDPQDPRYRYPFINCTNCGPRFTIISGLPYDRPMTTMSSFPLCQSCEREYHDHRNRRFHAQPVACKKCGPRLALLDVNGELISEEEKALDDCISFIAGGGIAAVKGIGGFHLACLPFDSPVIELRRRKKRPHKPLAIMVRDEETAEKIVTLSPFSRLMLKSPRRPIVICPKKNNPDISEMLAPFQDSIGIMLPYAPLHHLMLEKIPALVMTSANISEAPIISTEAEAVRTLGGIADRFLVHDREILMKIDDSVLTIAGKKSILIRRGRGFVPHPIIVKRNMPQILAAGAEMKSTFSLTREKTIFVSQYLGDLKQMQTAIFYEKTLRHFLSLFGLRPGLLAADMHPSYACADIAKKVIGEPEEILLVQHHHAHLAACLVENGHAAPAIGIILDGTGLGTDRTTWGGEFLTGDLASFERRGTFLSAALPGGDRSVLEPWRFGLSLMKETFGSERAAAEAMRIWPEMGSSIGPVLSAMDKAPVTTSCGRLFDAVSALLRVRMKVSYEGQAAMELEASARGARERVPFGISKEDGVLVLDWRPAIRWMVEEGIPLGKNRASAAFHFGLAEAVSDIALEISEKTGLKAAALSGGVWQNRRLSTLVDVMLKRRGLTPLFHKSLSPNDECISVGQAAIASEYWRKKPS